MEDGLYLITDGAFKGKTSKKAGSGIIIHKKIGAQIIQHEFMYALENFVINDIKYEVLNREIPPGKYRIELIHESDNLYRYKVGEYIIFNIYIAGTKTPGTNNRAEYLAYLFGQLLCDIMYPDEPIALVSDSNLLIQTLKVWMQNWVRQNIVATKKNPDIITQFIQYKRIKKYIHINSHLTVSDYQKLTPEFKEYSKLNDRADVLANEAII